MLVMRTLIVHSNKGPTLTSISNDDFVYKSAHGKDTLGGLPLSAKRSYEHTKIFRFCPESLIHCLLCHTHALFYNMPRTYSNVKYDDMFRIWFLQCYGNATEIRECALIFRRMPDRRVDHYIDQCLAEICAVCTICNACIITAKD